MVTNIEILEVVEELMALWTHEINRVLNPTLKDMSVELILAKAHYMKMRKEVVDD